MKTPKEEYADYPSLSVPARYGHDLHTKSKDEPIVVVCGIEEPKIHLVPSELQEFARQINEAITHDLGLESGTCEVEYRGLTASVDFYAEYESRIGGSHDDGSVERYAEYTGDRVCVRVVYDQYGREYCSVGELEPQVADARDTQRDRVHDAPSRCEEVHA